MKLRYGIILTALVLLFADPASAFTDVAGTATESVEVAEENTFQAYGNEYSTLDEFKASTDYIKFIIDNLWILIAAFMVLMMHLGFATVESGLTQAKNAVNVIYKNVFILTIGIILYAFIGFQIMYPGDFNGFFGFGALMLLIPLACSLLLMDLI